MAKQLTCTFYIGGKQVDKLTPEQLNRMSERLSKTMSEYYSRHPEEYKKLKSDTQEEFTMNEKDIATILATLAIGIREIESEKFFAKFEIDNLKAEIKELKKKLEKKNDAGV